MGRSTQIVILMSVGVLLIFGGLSAGIVVKKRENRETAEQIEQMQIEIGAHQATVARRPAKERLRDEIERLFDQVVEILPLESPQQTDRVKTKLGRFATHANLEFREVVTGEAREATDATGQQPQAPSEFGPKFEQTELTYRMQGSFADFLRFLNEVERHPRVLRVDRVALNPTPGRTEPRVLDITLTVSTFHYVAGSR